MEIARGESAEAKPWQSNLRARRKGQRLVKPENRPRPVTGEQRMWLLDMWERSAIPGSDFAALVGISRYTLYAWKKKFETEGPAGLLDKPRGARKGSRLPDLTRRCGLADIPGPRTSMSLMRWQPQSGFASLSITMVARSKCRT